MLKLKLVTILALGLILVFACKKQSLITYKGPNTIYFADSNAAVFLDSATMTFAYSPSTVQDSFFAINVYVTGGPSTTDRVYSVAADPSSTAIAGSQYVLPDSAIFHAGHVKDTLYIKFLRAATLQDSTFHLIVDLKPNNNFLTNMPFLYDQLGDTLSATSFTIAVNDVLTAGPWWTIEFQAFFGAFSVKKVQLMNQIVGMPLDFWASLNNLYLAPEAQYYAINFAKYLDAQAAAGNTILDTNGQPMTMGAAYQ